MKQIKIETTTDLQLSIQIVTTHIINFMGTQKIEDEIALCIYNEVEDDGDYIFNHVTITKENALFLATQLLELSK